MSFSTPVVLVHGFLSTRRMMIPFRWQLSRYGFSVSQPKLSFLCIQDVRRLASQVAKAVEAECERRGVDQVDLVGVSQGGIIGLYYLLHVGGSQRVRRLVLVGSPVRGSFLALGGLPLLGAFSKGIRQLRPGSSFLKTLTSPIPEGVRVSTVSVRRDIVSPPSRCSIDSAHDNVILEGPLGPLKHQWIAMSPSVVETVGNLLSAQ